MDKRTIRSAIPLAANLSMLFAADVTWPQRCARAAAAGFTFAEILNPYDAPAQQYRQWLDDAGLRAILINTPVADHFGMAAVDGGQAQFRRDIAQAVDVAHILGARFIHVMAGRAHAGSTVSLPTLLDNLQWALRRVENTRLILTLEALNRHDVPGYFYHDPGHVAQVLAALPSAQLRQQFDLYHTQREGLDLLAQLHACRSGIAHVQIAQSPARNEPDPANAPLWQAIQVLQDWGYAGWLGCEYRPAGSFETGLTWLHSGCLTPNEDAVPNRDANHTKG